MDADVVILRTASAQHAVAGRRQLLEAGVPADVVDRRVGKGVLVAVHAGVYRIAGSPETWPQRLMAATLAAGPGAVASTAARRSSTGSPTLRPGSRWPWRGSGPPDRPASSSTGWPACSRPT